MFRAPARRRPARRRGTILLVVLTLLALFAVIGLSFAFYAESSATQARIAREAVARGNDQPPDPTEALNKFLGQLLYPVPDANSGDVMSALRGHELARLIYGFDGRPLTPPPVNNVPYNGHGLIHETISGLPRLGATFPIPPAQQVPPIDRAQVINFALLPDWWNGESFQPGMPRNHLLFDPEYTYPGNVIRTGPNVATDAVPASAVYVGKNAPYTYPDRNNAVVALVDPNTGRVVIPSLHRPSLFGSLDPTNPNWYTASGRFKILRPRRIDHLTDEEKVILVQQRLQPLNLWPIPENPNPTQVGQIITALNTPAPGFPNGLGQFPEPSFNADGTKTGDVQNLLFANGLQAMDSVWIDFNGPVSEWRGRRIKPLIAALVVPLDGRINLNVAGNTPGGSNMGFGPWEQGLGHVLASAANADPINQTRIGGATFQGIRTSGNGTAAAPYVYGTMSKNFQPDPYNQSAAASRPQGYASVDWDGRGATAPMLMPGDVSLPAAQRFGSDPTSPAAGYGNADPAEATTHPGLFYPYHWDPFRMGSVSTVPGTFPLSDMRRLAGRYSDRLNTYRGLTYVGFRASTTAAFGELAPDPATTSTLVNSPSNAVRARTTLMSNSHHRPGLTPSVFGNPGVRYEVAVGPVGTLPGLALTAPTDLNFDLAAINTGITGGTWTNPKDIPVTTGPPVTYALRNGQAVLSGVDLNRHLTDYRVDTTQPLGVAVGSDPLNVSATTYNAAWLDRQNLARDIFARLVSVTGANANPDPAGTGYMVPATTITVEQTNALRWLAQLAANIVDYIDNDDVSTAFVWNPTAPANPLDAANFDTSGTPTALSQRVVFGTEKPRLVINEVHAEIANHPADRMAGTASQAYQVRFFLELLNPGNTETNAQSALAGPDTTALGSVPLRFGAGGISVYQVQVFTNDATVADELNGPNAHANVTGSATTPARLTCSMIGAFPVTVGDAATYPNLAERVEPNNGNFSVAPGVRNGFAVIGPQVDNATAGDGTSFTPDIAADPYNMVLIKPLDPVNGPDQLQYTVPQGPQADIATTVMPALNTNKHAVLLRRLACPYLPEGPTNPYITVDYQGQITVNNAVRVGADAAQMPAPMPTDHWSLGRVQPLTATGDPTAAYPATLVLRQKNLDPVTSMPTGKQVTFFKHNSIASATPPTPPTIPGQPPTPDDTLLTPFEWLVHLDRKLVSPAELLNVSTVRPYELTHQFAQPQATGALFHQHDLVRLQPNGSNLPPTGAAFANNSPLYRAMEFLTVKPWGHGLAQGGRVPGKVNINMIWDPAILRAVLDRQNGNNFTDAEISGSPTALWERLIVGTRTRQFPNSVSTTFDEDHNPATNPTPDRPFKSLGAAFFPRDTSPNQMAGASIDDTLLRRDGTTFEPVVYLPQTATRTHPYQRAEALRKMFNSVTTVSDNYMVVLTVGYFEVRQGVAGDPANPPVLGKEVYDRVPADMRHRFFSIVDRTNLTTGFAPNPLADPGQGSHPWVNELQTPVVPAGTANTPVEIRIQAEVAQAPATNLTEGGKFHPTTEVPPGSGFKLINPSVGGPSNNLHTVDVRGTYDGTTWSVKARVDTNVPADPGRHVGDHVFLGVGLQSEQLELFFDPTDPVRQWSYNPTTGTARIFVRPITVGADVRRHEAGSAVSNAVFGNPGTPGVTTGVPTFNFRDPQQQSVIRYVGRLSPIP